MNEESKAPTITASVAMKVNLGNYESADAFVSVSGLEAGATPVSIDCPSRYVPSETDVERALKRAVIMHDRSSAKAGSRASDLAHAEAYARSRIQEREGAWGAPSLTTEADQGSRTS